MGSKQCFTHAIRLIRREQRHTLPIAHRSEHAEDIGTAANNLCKTVPISLTSPIRELILSTFHFGS